jgi:DNA modification methylase
VVESERVATRPGNDTKVGRVSIHEDSPYADHAGVICGNRDPQRHMTQANVVGYRPTCTCPEHEPVGCRVCDIFSGTGTTGQTACFLGHDYTGIELNPEYAAHSEEWIAKTPRWHLRKTGQKPVKKRKHREFLPLFD